MGEQVDLQAADGHRLTGYLSRPHGAAKGALVVVQEIFGVNAHIRSVADRYAAHGYLCIAPALFDRFEPGVELRYSGEDMQRAFAFYGRLDPRLALFDLVAAADRVQGEGAGTGVLGFCYGGFMAWIAAVRGKEVGFAPRCAVGYYPGGIGRVAEENPVCPVLLHFGAEDAHIGADQRDAVSKAHPDVQIYVYEGAGHAFNREVDTASFAPQVAALAQERTLAFLAENLD